MAGGQTGAQLQTGRAKDGVMMHRIPTARTVKGAALNVGTC